MMYHMKQLQYKNLKIDGFYVFVAQTNCYLALQKSLPQVFYRINPPIFSILTLEEVSKIPHFCIFGLNFVVFSTNAFFLFGILKINPHH